MLHERVGSFIMMKSLTESQYHYVWKTKYSYHVLKGEIALRLCDTIREICADKKISIEKGNVRSNHIHILVNAPSYRSPAKQKRGQIYYVAGQGRVFQRV